MIATRQPANFRPKEQSICAFRPSSAGTMPSLQSGLGEAVQVLQRLRFLRSRGVGAVRGGWADCQCVTDKNVLRVPILWRETFERRTASESFTYIRSSLRRQELEDWLKVNASAFRIAAERAEHVKSSQRFLLGGLVTSSLKVC